MRQRSHLLRAGRRAAVVAALALPLGSCNANLGVPSALNVGKVGASIARETRRAAGVPARVKCPDQILVHKGTQFTCTAHFAVGHFTVTITQIDDKGHVRYNYPSYRVLDIPSIAYHLEQRMSAKLHHHVAAVCPQPVIEQAGENFTCLTASRDGTEHKVVVTQTGTSAGLTFTVKPESDTPSS